MTEKRAQPTVMVDNSRVRVTEWRFAPGTATGHHRHEFDYVVVPMTAGKLLIKHAAGESYNNIVAGAPYYRESGAEHDVLNDTDDEVVFIEIEAR